MSEDTISRIKLRLNNNLRSKQSKSQTISALSNRMSATDYSACNDFFANCCNCCGPGCDCCPCLSGFWIIVTGWGDGGDCRCEGLNGGPVWAPRHIIDDQSPTTSCLQGGQVPGFQTFGFYDCRPRESRRQSALHWSVYCIDGKLWLNVTQNTNQSRSLAGALTSGIVASVTIEVEDCDSLAIDEIVDCEVGTPNPNCICPSGIRIQTFPVFHQQLPPPYPPLPAECLCCPERCGYLDPDCLNPIPMLLTCTVVTNCGTHVFSLVSLNTDPNLKNQEWEGNYTLICCEQNFTFGASVHLQCDGANDFTIDYDLNYGAAIRGFSFVNNIVSCDPFSVTASGTPDCGPLTGSSCEPPTFCIISITITE